MSIIDKITHPKIWYYELYYELRVTVVLQVLSSRYAVRVVHYKLTQRVSPQSYYKFKLQVIT